MKTEIPLSRTKTIFGIVACISLALFILNVSTVISRDNSSRSKDMMNAGSTMLIIFMAITVWLIIKLFNRKPGLVINETGITDNASSIKAGLIKWQDIKNIRSVKQHSNQLLLITVTNPNKYIDVAHSLKKPVLQMNINMHGTPVIIPSATLNYDFAELQTVLTEAYKKYKK